MAIPVIQQLRAQHPYVELTVASQRVFRPLFDAIGVRFIETALHGRHKGLSGLCRLYSELKPQRFDAVADLHGVLRSDIIDAPFRWAGVRVARIDKERADKARLTRKSNKQLQRLKSVFQRYADVFESLGLQVGLDDALQNFLGFSKERIHAIGIAPFAAYREKTYPLERVKRLIQIHLAQSDKAVYLFSGPTELRVLDEMAAVSPRIKNAGRLSLREQLQLMARLSVLLSMDSANMHLASLVGTPVVSIWLATHPYAGFLGYGQRLADCLQRADLSCRPCSVFGHKRCWRADWACHRIDEQMIAKKLLAF